MTLNIGDRSSPDRRTLSSN